MRHFKQAIFATLTVGLLAASMAYAGANTAAPAAQLPNNGMALGLPHPTDGSTAMDPKEEARLFQARQTALLLYIDNTISDMTKKRACIAVAKDLQGVAECGNIFGTNFSSMTPQQARPNTAPATATP